MITNRKIASWNICSVCNYSCSYCSQGKRHEQDPDPQIVLAIARYLSSLGAGWEVKVSGGEPFLCRSFFEAITILSGSELLLSIVTNFSLPEETYERFIMTAQQNLRTISISYHPEFTEWENFLLKSVRLKNRLQQYNNASIVINMVMRPHFLGGIARIKESCDVQGLRLYPQIQRVRGIPVDFDEEELKILKKLFGSSPMPKEVNTGFSFKGKKCSAGADYFIVSQNGDCFTCYPAKRNENGYLGNAAEGTVRLKNTSSRCVYDCCPCSVPMNRGIIG